MVRLDGCWGKIAVFLFFAAAICSWIAVSVETFRGSPGRAGDDVYFENIAYHLARGHGFRLDFSDADWQQAYRDANTDGQNDWIFFVNVRGVTTSRAPGLPLLAAGFYKIVGRDWLSFRIANILILATALTMAVQQVYRLYGSVAGLIATLTIGLDYFVLQTAGQFMTESLGTAIVCFLFVACIHLYNDNTRSSAVKWLLVGVLFGFGTLVRANLNAWFLLLAAGLVLISSWRFVRGQLSALFLRNAVLFLLGCLVITAPWWIRNCRVTHAFAPFGTSGSYGLVGGYCDEAFADFGNWQPGPVAQSHQFVMQQPGILQNELAVQEYRMGLESVRRARQWTGENPDKIIPLMIMKGISHWGFYRQPKWIVALNGLLFFGAVIGMFASRNDIGRFVALAIALSTITVMTAWPHYGRYSIPVRPLLHIASGIGTVFFWRFVLSIRRSCPD